MPKDPTKNIDRYKVAGGDLNEFEFQQNQEELSEQGSPEPENLIPGTPPEQKVEEVTKRAEEVVQTRANARSAKPSTKKTTRKATRKAPTRKKTTKKTAAKKQASKTRSTKKAGKKQASKPRSAKKAASKRTTKKKAAPRGRAASKRKPARKK
jgi:hypothetical protein